MTIVFEDGMATITQYPPEGTGGPKEIIQTALCAVDGDTVILTVTSMLVDGQPQGMENEMVLNFTFDGVNLTTSVVVDANGTTVHMVFREQN